MHKAWSHIEEVPFCFSRSSIKFKGHTGRKIADFDQNWGFLDSNSSLNSPIRMCSLHHCFEYEMQHATFHFNAHCTYRVNFLILLLFSINSAFKMVFQLFWFTKSTFLYAWRAFWIKNLICWYSWMESHYDLIWYVYMSQYFYFVLKPPMHMSVLPLLASHSEWAIDCVCCYMHCGLATRDPRRKWYIS